jgi:hypothetical protein
MMDKRKKYSSSCDVLLGDDASTAQDWIVEGAYVDDEVDPVVGLNDTIIDEAMGMEPRRSKRVRELHEVEEFVSDNESEHDVDLEENIEFESDDDGVIETNDNEDDEDVMQP